MQYYNGMELLGCDGRLLSIVLDKLLSDWKFPAKLPSEWHGGLANVAAWQSNSRAVFCFSQPGATLTEDSICRWHGLRQQEITELSAAS
jgi:hypothetical protein